MKNDRITERISPEVFKYKRPDFGFFDNGFMFFDDDD